MISAWDVYWVMQLDSIKGALAGLTMLLSVAFAVGAIITGCHASEDDHSWNRDSKAERLEFRRRIRRWMFVAAPLALTFLVAHTLTPSTKTAAAMIVLPALTSEEVTKPLAKEAGDLYRLAKKALADAVGDDGAD